MYELIRASAAHTLYVENKITEIAEKTSCKCLPCKQPRRLPLALFIKSFILVLILPDNQFVNVIIK